MTCVTTYTDKEESFLVPAAVADSSAERSGLCLCLCLQKTMHDVYLDDLKSRTAIVLQEVLKQL